MAVFLTSPGSGAVSQYIPTVGFLQLANGVAMSGSLVAVTDQENTTSPLKLSTTGVYVPSASFLIGNASSTFNYTIYGAAIGANYRLTLPLVTANDTLAALGVAQTFSAANIFNASGALSTPALSLKGTWLLSGGTSTTTKPQFLIEPTGANSTNWSTNGTGIGVNALSGYTGNLIDLQVDGSSKFKVSSTGILSGVTLATNNVAVNSFYDNSFSKLWATIGNTTAKVTWGSAWNNINLPTTRPAIVGDFYVDTAANILANGDKIVAIRQ